VHEDFVPGGRLVKEALEIYIDGACSGNPGEAAIGVVIRQQENTIKEISSTIGEATNNIAEYSALVVALQEALILKADRIKIYTDSELVFKQVTGSYKVKNEKLRFLLDQALNLIKGFNGFAIQHIPREKNQVADKLATDALKKKKQAKVVAPAFCAS